MNQTSPTAPTTEAAPLTLSLNDIAHLFNAPRVDPFSPGVLEGLGVSGVEHLLNLLHMDRARQRARSLTLRLPAEKAAALAAEQITVALRRYARLRMEREQHELRNTYRYGWRVAGFAILMLAVCLGLSSLFGSDLTQWLNPLVRKTFEYGFEIIGWVILWHPIDVLVFSPVSIRARLRALQTLATVEVAVVAEPVAMASPFTKAP